MRGILITAALALFSAEVISAQSISPVSVVNDAEAPVKIALDVPAGTPLRVVLDKEVRIGKAGQPIQGKIAEPVYAYDKLVVPAGSVVSGSVTQIAHVPPLKRTEDALDANFSPKRDVEITFDQLKLPDGRSISLRTQVSPDSQGVLKFAIAADLKDQSDKKNKKTNKATELVSTKAAEKKQEINQDWDETKKLVATHGRLHRLERLAMAQLPVHPQYLNAGTRFNAELVEALDFGSEELSPEKVRMVGTTPADGSIVHALLKTPLNSSTSQKGETVEAVITEPLIADNHLILPEGTVLRGSVLQVQPARNMHRNGQLRIVFHEILPPQTGMQHVEASLEGVEVNGDENLSLDSEGGAQASSPKTRYLSTAVSLAVAGLSYDDDLINRILNGESGYNLIGLGVGVLSHSHALAVGFGAVGASRSLYKNFLSHGHDVVYPRDTAMAIGFGSRVTTPPKASKSDAGATTENRLASK